MKKILILLACLLFIVSGWAQKSIFDLPVINMPGTDNQQLLEDEMKRRGPGIAPRFAVNHPVDITPDTHGEWETLSRGQAQWQVRLKSVGAYSVNLGFSEYQMPEGGELYLIALQSKEKYGPFTPADNETHKQLWTPIASGDEVVVRVILPAVNKSSLRLRLSYVNHAFLDFGSTISMVKSGSCNLDVICGAADGFPDVDNYRDIIQSVAVISLGGGTFCTGFLVNNTAQDCKPYFMTADHCGIGPGQAPSLVAYWNYQNSTCRQPNSAASGQPGDGSLADFNTGSFFRADYSPSDMTLVELDDPVNTSANAFYAGWDRTSNNASMSIAIHHPSTDEKRISFEYQATQTTSYFGTSSPGDGTHVRVVDWDVGTTEGGSSGSPLFDQNSRVIGQLHGGGAACGNNSSDWYGRISVSWAGGGSSATRLSDWLDPLGSGVMQIDGKWGTACDIAIIPTPLAQDVCQPSNAVYSIEVASGFSGNVTLSATGSPAGTIVNFSVNPVSPGATSIMTISNTGSATPGTYSIDINGTDGTDSSMETVTLTLQSGPPSTPTPTEPLNGDVCESPSLTLSWLATTGGVSYEVDVATDPAFFSIVYTTMTTNTSQEVDLSSFSSYYWRVRATNNCGTSGWSAGQFFSTADLTCTTFNSTDVPVAISSSGTPTITSDLFVNFNGIIKDIDVVNLNGTHTWINDLSFSLTSPGGTTIQFMANSCGNQNNFDINFDDEAAPGGWPCPPTDGGAYQPSSPLSAFDGEEMVGTWTLTVADGANQDGGSLNGWGLVICANCMPPSTPTNAAIAANGSSGSCFISGTNDLRYLEDGSGDPIIAIHDNGNNLGAADVATYDHGVPFSLAGTDYLERSFEITTTCGPASPVLVRLMFTPAELANLVGLSPAVSGIGDLLVTQLSGGSEVLGDPSAGNPMLWIPVSTGTAPGGNLYVEVMVSGFSTFFLNGQPQLPIELVTFTAEPHKDFIQLNWITESEVNANGFGIERSVDGNNFIEIGRENALGGPTTTQNYAYIDKNVKPGIDYYYRLRLIDNDGSYTYSSIAVTRIESQFTSMQLTPNPVSGSSTLLIGTNRQENARLFITDVIGRIWMELEITLTPGNNIFDLDSAVLPSGIYFISRRSDSLRSEVIRFIKH